ncbi:sn-glycerol-3-phosphate ABC transporter ATP-binding protein UgpC [Mesorhizobium sp. YR577]|uniref:ABC transporter ATP-binding protein n=1 Tax=Mesorhizobium sp. YR577 TaxID=1884373 RepID=UPI0008E11AD5|nr:sn-glycerol-3-phosphate ABC transporter ATP-binding protein UgpC [Mesorhizobium sp. YR577]SFU21760.1 carbohydrate ABC transporter ATP-binding protein, CUT1 family [Mesorhizobium sp. YR577]
MADVTLKNVGKTYENASANTIESLNLGIISGEFVVLVGPSGCGKSTTLRMIAGLEEVSSGEIWIADRRVDELEPRERDIAMVFQNYALYPHMSVAQNMSFGLRLAGMDKMEIRRRVEDAARILDITPLLDRRPKQLSGGQRQRVAMGRAMVRDPAVFLFDEPLSNLDAKLRGQMRTEIRRLHKRLKATTIYVTHDQVEAMTLADRVVVLNQGRIEQQGTPLELYERPATRFVAGFIGSPTMNFLPAKVEMAAGKPVLKLEGVTLQVPFDRTAALAHYVGRSVEIGLRPEHFLAGGAKDFTVSVDMAELLGPTTLLHFSFAGVSCSAMLPPEQAAAEGSHQRLRIAAERMSLFDTDTGRAICADGENALTDPNQQGD